MPRVSPSRPAPAIVLLLLITLILPRPAGAMCCPFPCNDCQLLSQGQMNYVVMDRAAGRIRLIPNIRIRGSAPDFALVIPTPAEPRLSTAPKEIWTEASQLTAAISLNRSSGDLGCATTDIVANAPPSTDDGEVIVVSHQTVGCFDATVVTSSTPSSLIDWLREHGYGVDEAEAAALTPYAARGWYFLAMRLDSSQAGDQMPPGGWDNNVTPIEISFAGTELEVPLAILGLNRASQLPMVFYVLDDHRVDLAGFTTTYANRISGDEQQAIEGRFPHLAAYTTAGRCLTRLDHTFFSGDAMAGSIAVTKAADDEEFRRVNGSNWGSLSVDWLVMLGSVGLGRLRRRKES